MAKTYKEYEEDLFKGTTPGEGGFFKWRANEPTGPKDVTITGETEGGIPQTESGRIIEEGRRFQKKWIRSTRKNLRAKVLTTPELAVFVRYTNSSAQVVDMEGETWEVDPKNVFFNQLNEVEHAC